MYPEENRAVFAANLKKLMDEKGVDRGDLARAVGVPYTTVNDWYNGATYPRIRNIEEIARFFKVTKSVLIEVQPEGMPSANAQWLQAEIASACAGDIIVMRRLYEIIKAYCICRENKHCPHCGKDV